MKIGVLALQGAFIEHRHKLSSLGIDSIELRQKEDLKKSFDALILPGGESTVQGKLLRDLGMFQPLQAQIQEGLPVLATCAGLILLAQNLSNDTRLHFATLPITVKRNAYGKQLGSFFTYDDFKPLGQVPMTFIRAPYIEAVSEGVEVHAIVDGNIVAVEYKNQLALSFHPELNDDMRLYHYFLEKIKGH
jgi:pyridoxal 5'-phosphate synthase, glutaminase subunit pdx2